MSKKYMGSSGAYNLVEVHDRNKRTLLDPRLDLAKHSNGEFLWGLHSFTRHGCGPAQQLALAILADYLEDDAVALQYYQSFNVRMVSKFQIRHGSVWTLTGDEIDAVILRLKAERGETAA